MDGWWKGLLGERAKSLFTAIDVPSLLRLPFYENSYNRVLFYAMWLNFHEKITIIGH